MPPTEYETLLTITVEIFKFVNPPPLPVMVPVAVRLLVVSVLLVAMADAPELNKFGAVKLPTVY